MKFMLDTGICIYLIKKRSASVFQRLQKCDVGDIGISVVTAAELRYGADKSQRPRQNHQALDIFFAPLEIVPFTEDAAVDYGKIRVDLEASGDSIGPLDTLIAAHAKHLNATLVSNNIREFKRVRGLKVENWT